METLWTGLRETLPGSATIFEEMQAEESGHRASLLELYRTKFGDHIPHIRRQDVKGFVERRPVWAHPAAGPARGPQTAELMELEAPALLRTCDPAGDRRLDPQVAGRPGAAESKHSAMAGSLEATVLTPQVREAEDVHSGGSSCLQIVQPGLAGLMDGSVSTLAPVFAAASRTRNSWDAFLVGMAASVGAGISMALRSAVGRRHAHRPRPSWIRGLVCA